MDEVAVTGTPLLITKHGRPVAQLVPPPGHEGQTMDALRGAVGIDGDVVSPALEPADIDAFAGIAHRSLLGKVVTYRDSHQTQSGIDPEP